MSYTALWPYFCPGCHVEWGIDYNGNDIPGQGELPVKDVNHCIDLCAALEKCTVWTYSTSKSWCYLKTSSKNRMVNAGAVSGTKMCKGKQLKIGASGNHALFTGPASWPILFICCNVSVSGYFFCFMFWMLVTLVLSLKCFEMMSYINIQIVTITACLRGSIYQLYLCVGGFLVIVENINISKLVSFHICFISLSCWF